MEGSEWGRVGGRGRGRVLSGEEVVVCAWRVVLMKILSYNVRGLGGGEKRVEVRRLVQEKCPFVLCIRESKLRVVDDFLIKSIWGDAPCSYSFQPSVGA